jgi:hypothetical protein
MAACHESVATTTARLTALQRRAQRCWREISRNIVHPWRTPAPRATSLPRACFVPWAPWSIRSPAAASRRSCAPAPQGDLDIARFLVLERNATVYQARTGGGTPLWYAIPNGWPSVERFVLTDRGAAARRARKRNIQDRGHPAARGCQRRAPCLSHRSHKGTTIVAFAAVPYDAGGAIAELAHPTASTAAAWAGAEVLAQKAWLMAALARALRGV